MKPAKSVRRKNVRTYRRDACDALKPNVSVVSKRKRPAKGACSARGARKLPVVGGNSKDLKSKSKLYLVNLAERVQIPNPRTLPKDQLIRSLEKVLGNGAALNGNGHKHSLPTIRSAARRTQEPSKSGAAEPKQLGGAGQERRIRQSRDRIVTMVRDPFWLHVHWELSAETIQRSQVALGADWYTAQPILRLLDVTAEDTTTSSEAVLRDIVIHGGVNNWYVDIDGQAREYRVDIGYRTQRARFHVIGKSNIVRPPKAGSTAKSDNHFCTGRQETDRIFAMTNGGNPQVVDESLRRFFEEKFRRPISAGSLSNYGSGALAAFGLRSFHFDIEAELVVHGKTASDARVLIGEEPIVLREDGSFSLRFELPDGRRILRATAHTSEGVEERTIILAVERNTKALEPTVHDGQEE